MKILLLLLSLSFLFSIPLQGQCVFEIDELDDFEGFHRLTTESRGVVTNFGGDQIYISFTKNGDSYFIDVDMLLNASSFSISEGREIYFKLENGEIIKAPAANTVISNYMVMSDKPEADVRYNLTREQLKQFTESPIEQIRIHFRNTFRDVDVRSKRRGSFTIELARCILNKNE